MPYPQMPVGNDEGILVQIYQDLSGGSNSRQHPSLIPRNQAVLLQNVDLTYPGERRRRPGITLLEDLGALAITGMFFYDPQGNDANLLVTEGTNLKRWALSGAFAAAVKSDFTTSLDTKMIKAFKTGVGDVALVSNGTDNVFEMTPAYAMNDLGNTNTSPPKTIVLETYRNRVWGLKSDLLYFSTAAPADYAAAFDRTTNVYRIPVGSERVLLGTRDLGLIIGGKEQIWVLNPSTTPAATDKPEKISDYGIASGDTFVQVGDDYYYLAFDGVRGLKRTEQDKLQYGTSLPISWPLKTQYDTINWGAITKACAVFWDNKYFLSLPVSGSSVNNQIWVYYPATGGWSVFTGLKISKFAKVKVSGEERLYGGEASADGDVYRIWSGATDAGTAIEFIETSRSEDFGKPVERKVGQELTITAKPSGNYDISVYAAFDEGGWNFLGVMNITYDGVTFPVTFPVTFQPESALRKTFHLDSYGEWYRMQYRIVHNAVTTNSNDVTIYDAVLTAIPISYDTEVSP